MSQLWWYTARATGIVSWLLLAAGVLWGLLLSTKAKALGRKPRPNWMLDLHRFLGGAGVAFVGVHVVAIMLDTYTSFGPVDVLVPLASSWHPVAVAWGIVAGYLLVAVEATSLMRKKLSKRAWRLTHLLSFPLYATATVHALSAGTDAAGAVFRAVAIAVSVLIAALTGLRIVQARRHTGTARPGPGPRPARPPVRPVAPAAGAPASRVPEDRVLVGSGSARSGASRGTDGPVRPGRPPSGRGDEVVHVARLHQRMELGHGR